MFCSFFTIPADRGRASRRSPRESGPSRGRVITTWTLLLVWLLLMSFGVVSAINPAWLQELSRPGIDTEALNYKKFADDHLRRREYRLAIGQYLYVLELKPDFTGAMVNLAIAYGQVGEVERGIQMLRSALQKEGDPQGDIYLNLGELLEKQGNQDAAMRAYEQAIESRRALCPDSDLYRMYIELGALHERQGELDKARVAYAAALVNKLDPHRAFREMLRRGLGQYRENGEVLQVIRRLIERPTEQIDLSRYDLDIIRYTQQVDPETAGICSALGRIYAAQGDLANAIVFLERALQIQPGNTGVRNGLQAVRRRLEAADPETGE
jgi:tetratricopeptide (TPR) repeat protein